MIYDNSHRLPPYPTPQCIYTYTQGVAGTKTAGYAHAYICAKIQ